jgi:hypothetical protein
VVVGQLRTAEYLAEVGQAAYLGNLALNTFRSFWGQFGWMAAPMDPRVYLALGLLLLTALTGLAARAVRLSAGQRRALGLLVLAVLLIFVAYLGYNINLVQFQGRYLFPGLIPLGLLFTLGLQAAFAPQRRWWLAAELALALLAVLVVSALAGDLYLWALLITGLLLALAMGRAWLGVSWLAPANLLLAGCYVVLALLAFASPFWFIVPNLSP